MNRNGRSILAKETLAIMRQGWYNAPAGRQVDISEALAQCIGNTRLYTPEELQEIRRSRQEPGGAVAHAKVEVKNETTLAGA